MEQHPDSQPGCAKAVDGGNDDDGDTDDEFEVECIDGAPQQEECICLGERSDARRSVALRQTAWGELGSRSALAIVFEPVRV